MCLLPKKYLRCFMDVDAQKTQSKSGFWEELNFRARRMEMKHDCSFCEPLNLPTCSTCNCVLRGNGWKECDGCKAPIHSAMRSRRIGGPRCSVRCPNNESTYYCASCAPKQGIEVATDDAVDPIECDVVETCKKHVHGSTACRSCHKFGCHDHEPRGTGANDEEKQCFACSKLKCKNCCGSDIMSPTYVSMHTYEHAHTCSKQ